MSNATARHTAKYGQIALNVIKGTAVVASTLGPTPLMPTAVVACAVYGKNIVSLVNDVTQRTDKMLTSMCIFSEHNPAADMSLLMTSVSVACNTLSQIEVYNTDRLPCSIIRLYCATVSAIKMLEGVGVELISLKVNRYGKVATKKKIKDAIKQTCNVTDGMKGLMSLADKVVAVVKAKEGSKGYVDGVGGATEKAVDAIPDTLFTGDVKPDVFHEKITTHIKDINFYVYMFRQEWVMSVAMSQETDPNCHRCPGGSSKTEEEEASEIEAVLKKIGVAVDFIKVMEEEGMWSTVKVFRGYLRTFLMDIALVRCHVKVVKGIYKQNGMDADTICSVVAVQQFAESKLADWSDAMSLDSSNLGDRVYNNKPVRDWLVRYSLTLRALYTTMMEEMHLFIEASKVSQAYKPSTGECTTMEIRLECDMNATMTSNQKPRHNKRQRSN